MHRLSSSRLVPACVPACLLVGLLAMAGSAGAAPAYWYQWRSLQNGSTVCSQTPLGEGWQQADGPYSDSNCTRRVRLIRL